MIDSIFKSFVLVRKRTANIPGSRIYRVGLLLLSATTSMYCGVSSSTHSIDESLDSSVPLPQKPSTLHSMLPSSTLVTIQNTSLSNTMSPAVRAAFIQSSQRDAGVQFHFSTTPQEATASAFNSAFALRAHATEVGLRMQSDAIPNAFSVSLRSFGCAESVGEMKPTKPRIAQNKVEYSRDNVTEWYVNGPLGIEQGFTVHRDLGCRGELAFDIDFGSDVTAELKHDEAAGARIELTLGQQKFVYSDLFARDALGKELPARMQVIAGRIRLVVDVHGARYPLQIDPLIALDQGLLNPPNGGILPVVGFGQSVAISGTTALVGAPGQSTDVGAAYAFRWDEVTKTWALRSGFSVGVPNNQFGSSVALSSDETWALIGAPNESTGAGKAYLFTRARTTDAWGTTQKAAFAPGGARAFGRSVAISSDKTKILIGAPNTSGAGVAKVGAAYLYSRGADDGSRWSLTSTITAIDPATDAGVAAEALFGSSLSLAGNMALIGAPYATVSGKMSAGAAYLFDVSTSTIRQKTMFSASDGIANAHFGASVALLGDTVLIGAPQAGSPVVGGAAYAFEASSPWVEKAKFMLGSPAANDAFGSSVSLGLAPLGELRALIGAPNRNPAGAAYVITRSSGMWSPNSLVLLPTTGESAFGSSVSLSIGNVALVGAPQNKKARVFRIGKSIGESCSGPEECASLACNDKKCGKKQGDACRASTECQTNFCVDGVCCDSACGGDNLNDCQACSVAKGSSTDGSCKNRSNTVVCRPATSSCDIPESCTGSDSQCPIDKYKEKGISCGSRDLSQCVADWQCDGSSSGAACKPVRAGAGTVCKSGNTVECIASYKCDDSVTIGSSACKPAPASEGTQCSSSSDPSKCIAGYKCDGATGSSACKPVPASEGTQCSSSSDSSKCIAGYKCDGITVNSCPTTKAVPSSSGTKCRSAKGICDVAEECNGTEAKCPDDTFAPTTQKCAVGNPKSCIKDKFCSGTGQCSEANMPADKDTVCNDSGNPLLCVASYRCDGITVNSCPTNNPKVASAGTSCSEQAVCDGSKAICPTNNKNVDSGVSTDSGNVVDSSIQDSTHQSTDTMSKNGCSCAVIGTRTTTHTGSVLSSAFVAFVVFLRRLRISRRVHQANC